MLPSHIAPGHHAGNDPCRQLRGVTTETIQTTWVNGDWEYDMAVLTIADSRTGFNHCIGDYMGYLGMNTQPCTYNKRDWQFTGYPGNKPAGTVWNTGVCDD